MLSAWYSKENFFFKCNYNEKLKINLKRDKKVINSQNKLVRNLVEDPLTYCIFRLKLYFSLFDRMNLMNKFQHDVL